MLVDGAGELIADIMTMNRSFASIPSASAILDTSNYTFQAISYGKNADGFRYHAHVILSPSGQDNGIIKVLSYQPLSTSSYHSSAIASSLDYIYKLLPESPKPSDTRLEQRSTVTNYSSGVPDVGHCLNSGCDPSLSSYSHLIGCFPRKSLGFQYWVVSSAQNPAGSILYSGTMYSNYNFDGTMDSSGFLTFASGRGSDHLINYNLGVAGYGVLRTPLADFPDKIRLSWYLAGGDAGSLLLFGGIYSIGLWYLDIKEMLKQGYYPPYSFNPLNNIRRYKLFAKKTFNRDILYLNDFGTSSGFNASFNYPSVGWGGLGFNWDIYFK